MKIAIVHGTKRESTTCMLAREACKVFEDAEIKEFFLPDALPHFCIGCYACYKKGETFCPHKEYTGKVWQALLEAEFLIFTTPVYVLHATGQMKAFLDHFGWAFMIHRPDIKMFSKAALVVSTAAGGGMKNAVKDITDSLKFWGVGKIYSYGVRVRASHISEIPEIKKDKLFSAVLKIAKKIKTQIIKGIKVSLKLKLLFNFGCLMQKHFASNALDAAYWKEQGWLHGKRPWRKV